MFNIITLTVLWIIKLKKINKGFKMDIHAKKKRNKKKERKEKAKINFQVTFISSKYWEMYYV